MRVYTLSDRRSKKELCVYTASEAKGLKTIYYSEENFHMVSPQTSLYL